MLKLKFDCRDILRAPRIAFSLQRMWIQLVGLMFGLFIYLIFTYGSLVAAGFPLKTAWAMNGLLPCLFAVGDPVPLYSWILYGIGSLMLLFAIMIANTAAARAIYMSSKGNSFYSWKESYAFAFRKAASVILTPVSLLLIIGLMVLGAFIVGLLGRIPFVGELGVSIFTIIWLISALLLFFFALVAVVATVMVPAILATTDEDAFEAIFQSFSICWGRPCRFIFYEALTIILSLFAMGAFAFFIKEAVMIMNHLFSAFMGADFVNLANNGQAHLQSWMLPAQGIVEKICGRFSGMVYFAREFVFIPAGDLPISVVISSYFYAFSLLFIGGWVLSYGFAAFSAGNALLFMVIKKHKDDENLLERKDAEEESEEGEAEGESEGKKENDEQTEATVPPNE
jgi:hypothetical protein